MGFAGLFLWCCSVGLFDCLLAETLRYRGLRAFDGDTGLGQFLHALVLVSLRCDIHSTGTVCFGEARIGTSFAQEAEASEAFHLNREVGRSHLVVEGCVHVRPPLEAILLHISVCISISTEVARPGGNELLMTTSLA
jgi:hypothetical protein